MKTFRILSLLAAAFLLASLPAVAENPWPYAEDTAHVSGDRGQMCLAVRDDAGAALAGTTGDYIPLTTDNVGRLRTTAACTIGGQTEDTAEAGGDELFAAGTVRRDTAASSAGTSGDWATLNTDSTGRLWSHSVVTNLGTAATQTEVTGKVADADVVTAAASLRVFSCEVQSDIDDSAYGTIRLGNVSGGNCTGAAIGYVSIGYVPAQPKVLSRHFDFGARGVAAAAGLCLDRTYGTLSVSCATVVEAAP